MYIRLGEGNSLPAEACLSPFFKLFESCDTEEVNTEMCVMGLNLVVMFIIIIINSLLYKE